MRVIYIFILALFILKNIVDTAERVKYITTERPNITYYNPKYIRYINITSRRHGRGDPFYYVDLHTEVVHSVGNNWTFDAYFYELLSNRYRRGFVEMHGTFCQVVQEDDFFGTGLRQGKGIPPCPFPPGKYHFYNMTVPIRSVPQNFPFTQGRIYVNVSGTYTKEYICGGYIDMEIKEARLKTTVKKN